MAARKKTAAKKTAAKKTGVRKTAAKKAARKTLSKGDRVSWNTSQGATQGVVEKKLTSPTDIKTHHVAASPENPEYLVRSEKSGEVAAHKPGSLRKTATTKRAKTSTAKVAKKAAKKSARKRA